MGERSQCMTGYSLAVIGKKKIPMHGASFVWIVAQLVLAVF